MIDRPAGVFVQEDADVPEIIGRACHVYVPVQVFSHLTGIEEPPPFGCGLLYTAVAHVTPLPVMESLHVDEPAAVMIDAVAELSLASRPLSVSHVGVIVASTDLETAT